MFCLDRREAATQRFKHVQAATSECEQPVVKVRRCTEGGDAPGRQGATSENIGNI
jgi:hypothetical protein